MNQPLRLAETDAHELGRQEGLAQAAAHLRGEVARLQAEQRRAFDGYREKLIDKLQRMARTVEGLK